VMARHSPEGRPAAKVRARSRACRAIHEALEIGLTPEGGGVAGRFAPSDLVLPRHDEDVSEYGQRSAVGNVVRYLLF